MELNRRQLLRGFATLVGAAAVEQVIPLGRVWSFPSKIVVPDHSVRTYTIGKYADYMNVSDLVMGDPLRIIEKEMSYRLSYTVNLLVAGNKGDSMEYKRIRE